MASQRNRHADTLQNVTANTTLSAVTSEEPQETRDQYNEVSPPEEVERSIHISSTIGSKELK
jgi:hypothetical protein